MIVFDNGNYETGDWLTAETYPDKTAYVVEEGSELALKIKQLYPFYILDIVDGALVDVTQRAKTQEEIDKENAPKPKTTEQLRIDQLETGSAELLFHLAQTQDLANNQSNQMALLLIDMAEAKDGAI